MSRFDGLWRRGAWWGFLAVGLLLYGGSFGLGEWARGAAYRAMPAPKPLIQTRDAVMTLSKDNVATARGIADVAWPAECVAKPEMDPPTDCTPTDQYGPCTDNGKPKDGYYCAPTRNGLGTCKVKSPWPEVLDTDACEKALGQMPLVPGSKAQDRKSTRLNSSH